MGYMNLQNKHSFDGGITVECLEYLLNTLFNNKNVVLSMDMDPAHHYGKGCGVYQEVVVRRSVGSWIHSGGITYFLQVCHLFSDQEFESIINNIYLKGGSEFLKSDRANT